MIEVPVVAQGGLDAGRIAQLTPFTDFFAFGDEIWRADDPAARLGELVEAMVDSGQRTDQVRRLLGKAYAMQCRTLLAVAFLKMFFVL